MFRVLDRRSSGCWGVLGFQDSRVFFGFVAFGIRALRDM